MQTRKTSGRAYKANVALTFGPVSTRVAIHKAMVTVERNKRVCVGSDELPHEPTPIKQVIVCNRHEDNKARKVITAKYLGDGLYEPVTDTKKEREKTDSSLLNVELRTRSQYAKLTPGDGIYYVVPSTQVDADTYVAITAAIRKLELDPKAKVPVVVWTPPSGHAHLYRLGLDPTRESIALYELVDREWRELPDIGYPLPKANKDIVAGITNLTKGVQGEITVPNSVRA